MAHALVGSIIRILGKDLKPVGVGVLIANKQILTCAHVVNQALGLSEKNNNLPIGNVLVDIALMLQLGRQNASTVFFKFDPLQEADDVAVLQIDSLPDGCKSAQLTLESELNELDFQVYGYPRGHDTGRWSQGKLGLVGGSKTLQIVNVDLAGIAVAKGFSGSPVWCEKLRSIVGIIVANDLSATNRTAFVIPTEYMLGLYSDLEGSIQSRRQSLLNAGDAGDHCSIGEHQIRISIGSHRKLHWQGGISPKQFGMLWKGPTDFKIAYEPLLHEFKEMTGALIRSSLHGIGGELYVTEPEKWKSRCSDLIDKCMGTDWDRTNPSVIPTDAGKWKLLPLTDYRDKPYLFKEEYTATDLAALLHAVMDITLLAMLNNSIESILTDEDTSELGLTIEDGLAKEMMNVWQEWHVTLSEHPELLSRFFIVMMSKADREAVKYAQPRVGLKTLTPCLLTSVIYALAIRVCLPWDFHPVIDERHANIKAKDGFGHLCGLELIETVKMVLKIGTLYWETEYVILPHLTDRGEDIEPLTRNLMSSSDSQSRLDRPIASPPLFLTGESRFVRAMSAGKPELQEHLKSVVAIWRDGQEAEIAHAVKEA